MRNMIVRWISAPLAPPLLRISRIESLILVVFFAILSAILLQVLFGSLKVTWGVVGVIALFYLDLLCFPLPAERTEVVNDN